MSASNLTSMVRRVLTLKLPEFPKEQLLFKFENKEDLAKWLCTSDEYFGGFSKAQLELAENHAKFRGTLDPTPPPGVKRSGYCAIRSRNKPFSLFRAGSLDLSLFDNLEFKLRADGGTYIANIQCDSFREDDLYQAFLYTKKSDNFETYKTHQGYVQYTQIPLNARKIRTIGIVFTSKVRGGFSLDLESIKATNDPDKEERLAKESHTI